MSLPKITTERTKLAFINALDLAAIHELHSLPETDEFNTLGIPQNIEETIQVIAPWISAHNADVIRNYTFKIEHISSSEFIGLIALKLWPAKNKRAEVWYKIHPKHWKKGYATEVLKAVIDFGFDELKLHRIQAGCAVENIASIKVLEKVGMKYEGRGRQVLPLKSGWSDNFEYSILDSDERIR